MPGSDYAQLEDLIGDLTTKVDSNTETLQELKKLIESLLTVVKKSQGVTEEIAERATRIQATQDAAYGVAKGPDAVKPVQLYSHQVTAKPWRGGTKTKPAFDLDYTKLARELSIIAALEQAGSLIAVIKVIEKSMHQDAFEDGVIGVTGTLAKAAPPILNRIKRVMTDLVAFGAPALAQTTNKDPGLKNKVTELAAILKEPVHKDILGYQKRLASLFQCHPEAPPPDTKKGSPTRIPFTSTFLCAAWVRELPEASADEVGCALTPTMPVPQILGLSPAPDAGAGATPTADAKKEEDRAY